MEFYFDVVNFNDDINKNMQIVKRLKQTRMCHTRLL